MPDAKGELKRNNYGLKHEDRFQNLRTAAEFGPFGANVDSFSVSWQTAWLDRRMVKR